MRQKFRAGLTENQPNAYLKRLPRHKALLFVAPALRIETLWAELCRLAGVVGPYPASNRAEFKSVVIDGEKNGHRWLMLVSWPYLLDVLARFGDSDMEVEIRQLRGLAKRIDESEFPPLRPDELAPAIPRRLRGLRRLVDDAAKRLIHAGHADIEGLKVASLEQGYGRYIRVAGAWFGIAADLWARGSYPDTPLWLYFQRWKGGTTIALERTRKALDPLGHKDPRECFDDGNSDAVLVPIPLLVGVEYDAVLDAVVKKIQDVAELIHAYDHDEKEKGH